MGFFDGPPSGEQLHATDDNSSLRRERIERLLTELRYEVERGIVDHEIPEEMGFEFFVPMSRAFPHGGVRCRFQTRPIPEMGLVTMTGGAPRLKLVKD